MMVMKMLCLGELVMMMMIHNNDGMKKVLVDDDGAKARHERAYKVRPFRTG